VLETRFFAADMAAVLAPLAKATTIEHDNGTTVDPPPIEFPYPERHESGCKSLRDEDSETTLNDAALAQADACPQAILGDGQKSEPLERPDLASRKFETELVLPATPATPGMVRKNRSTTDHRDLQRLVHWESASSSDSLESDTGDLKPTLHRSQTQPATTAFSEAGLNRVRGGRRPDYLRVGNKHFKSSGKVAKDGRLNITLNETAQTGYLAKALGATIQSHLGPRHEQELQAAEQAKCDFRKDKQNLIVPSLNIVVMVIGSRGDIQPFLKIGKSLQKYGHRVRIASHPTFRKFVEDEIGLEFFSIGGGTSQPREHVADWPKLTLLDPAELMSFMVKNPGLIPSIETLKAGEVGRRRESMYEMFRGFWKSCVNATDDESDIEKLRTMEKRPPFVADAIIANPPSMAHYHCAEKLNIPLHLVFTFPYSPTQAFPHPLANIKSSNVDQSYTNFMSYPLVDLMTWQGLGDLVNRFRVRDLGLEPVSTLWAPGQLTRLKVPTTYLWSPGLVPKPSDWGAEIDIAGYVFLDLASTYKPPKDLAKFMDRSDGRPLIYIGFGSISGIDNPTAFARMIFDAVEKAGVRAVISRGWGGMGDGMDKTDGIFLVDNIPHDWLFPQVDAVVHHGGAGTTAAGLRFGKPTMIVPFFGDQPFWANMVAKAGAGAKEALPLKKLDVDKFAAAIRECLEPETKAKAEAISESIKQEGDGAENTVDSFHHALVLEGEHSIRCCVFPDRTAVWQIRHTAARLSALAASLLVEHGEIQWSDLDLVKNREWNDFHGPGEPITGAGGVMVAAFREAYHGISSMHESTKRDIKQFSTRRRVKNNKSAIQGLVLPGRIAMATRGARLDEQKKEHAELARKVNLHGEAEPAKLVRTTSTVSTENSPVEPIAKDIAKGIGHSTKAFATLPIDLWTSVALGFHNAPRLYGDKTVRPSPHGIDGFRSGAYVAGKEFCLGFYDGITGLIRVPQHDVRAGGMSALPKGVARGLGGLVLKPVAGIVGLGAYSAKGAQNSLKRWVRDTGKTERWIRRARMAQGQREAQALPENVNPSDHQLTPTFTISDARSHALRVWDTRRVAITQKQEQASKLLKLESKSRRRTIR
jgi:UDP:flavonoid glycosyltransferase YjiC (YdhE family)